MTVLALHTQTQQQTNKNKTQTKQKNTMYQHEDFCMQNTSAMNSIITWMYLNTLIAFGHNDIKRT